MNNIDLNGQIAVVTGGSRNIGEHIATTLAGAGANIVVNYQNNSQEADRVVAEIKELGRRAIAVQANIGLKLDVDRMSEQAMNEFGRVDILVNNAGINRDSTILEMEEEQWDEVIQTNLKGPFLTTQAFGRIMKDQGTGCIVNISAITGIRQRVNAVNYCSSKAGLNMLTRCAALELGPEIRVNALAVGFIDSPLVQELYTEENMQKVFEETPLQRAGTFQEVADTVLFFASEQGGFINGQTLIIDGGRVMR